MILNCPSCSAKFMISSEALGPDGREVRCGKCGHMWFQEGERDSLDDLPPEPVVINTDPMADIDIGFEPRHEPIPEILRPKSQNSKPEAKEKSGKTASARQKQIAGALVALAIIAVLFYALVVTRNTIGHAVPFTHRAYAAMGFPLVQEKPAVAIDRLKIVKQGHNLSGSMYLINLTSGDVSIGKIVAELTDFDYKTIKAMDVKIEEKILKSESSSKVDFSFTDVPKEAVSVRVKISP